MGMIGSRAGPTTRRDTVDRIVWNYFNINNPSHQAIIFATKVRTSQRDLPVRRTVIRGNFARILDNQDPYRRIHVHESTKYRFNWSGHKLVELLEGEQTPINPLLFVEECWRQLLGQSVP